jgi:hypothetical protein
VLLFGDLRVLNVAVLRDVEYFIGAFNGNRIFTDNNRQFNYLARLRKVFDGQRLAVGLSAQLGQSKSTSLILDLEIQESMSYP